jgi:hypothetical protein
VARAFGKGWREVGEFLPRSIVEWSDQWPIERQIEMWRAAGLVEMATKHMLFGTGVLIKGRKREG